MNDFSRPLNLSRPLNTIVQVEEFLQNSLGLNIEDKSIRRIVPSIVDGELGFGRFGTDSQTIDRKDMRSASHREDSDRWKLRSQIVNELWSQRRFDDDNRIKLGKGGATPVSGVKYEKKAFLLIGLPASGKSTIADKIAEDYGAIIVDSDYAKRKLPEFKSHLYGASIVQEESSKITFGFASSPSDFKSLYELCIDAGANIVVPRIGQNPDTIHKAAVALREIDYEVHLVL